MPFSENRFLLHKSNKKLCYIRRFFHFKLLLWRNNQFLGIKKRKPL